MNTSKWKTRLPILMVICARILHPSNILGLLGLGASVGSNSGRGRVVLPNTTLDAKQAI